jgi:predicted esterase
MSAIDATLTVELPLHLSARVPDGSGPFPVLIGLHGYAMSGAEMMEFLPRLAPEELLLVSLQGPQTALAPGGEKERKIGFHWGVSPRPEENRALHRSAVAKAIEWAVANGGDPDRVSLAGFSQPVSFGYRLGLHPPHGRPFRALVGICGGIPGEWASEPAPEETTPTAVFHASATHDPYYPLERVAHYEEALRARYESVTYRLYDGGHRIPSAAIPDIRTFLAEHGR